MHYWNEIKDMHIREQIKHLRTKVNLVFNQPNLTSQSTTVSLPNLHESDTSLMKYELEKLELYRKGAKQSKLENLASLRKRVSFYPIFKMFDRYDQLELLNRTMLAKHKQQEEINEELVEQNKR